MRVPVIPKVIHRIWFGSNPMPVEYEEWWKGWQRQLPNYEFITWDDRHIRQLTSAPLILQADSMAKRADIARYEIMHEFGGTYLDCDFMPVNYFDFVAQGSDLVICHESEVPEINCSNGFFSIRRGHPLMQLAMDLVASGDARSPEVIGATGPGFFGRLVRPVKHKRMPSRAFYPYYFNEPFSAIYGRDLSQSYGIHVWMNSWFNDDLRLRKINSMIVEGSLAEVERLWKGMGPQLQEVAGNIPTLISQLRQARTSMMEMAINSTLISQVERKAMPEFDLFQACHVLFSKEPGAVVWQIGAGDGIACDPLRPVLVNFDPPALLVEANPSLSEELKVNYANNRNLHVVSLAVGPSANDGGDAGPGQTHLYALHPKILRAIGGTDAHVGMTSRYSDSRTDLGVACQDEVTKGMLLRCMQLITVPLVDFAGLMTIANGNQPDVLVIDIAGVEDELVIAALDAGLLPRILRFNTRHMSQEALDRVLQRLHEPYELFAFEGYSMAFRNDFLINYCFELFVEHGRPTLFGKAMKIIAGLE